MQISINLIVAPIVGGLGTLFGPIIGALIIVPINEMSRDLAQSFSINGLNLLIYGLVLMTMIKLAPAGCWPWLARHLGLANRAWRAGERGE
jgi:branched-chain amino acid transport system permease protein